LQNIDALYFLTPLVTIGFSFSLVAFLWKRKKFSGWILLFSLVAYAGAIALKELVQAVTYQPFDAAVGGDPVALGLYFGLQTVVFEVGGAFLVASYAVARGRMNGGSAAGFGVGLALWENGALFGVPLLLDYAIFYLILGSGGTGASQLLNDLTKSSPALFYPPSSALPLVGYAILERVSSLLAHFSWGYLAVMAAFLGRRSYLWLALPMGLVDFFVPLSGGIGLGPSEALFFALSAGSFAVAMTTTAEARRGSGAGPGAAGKVGTASLVRTTIRRSVSFGRVYLGMGVLLPLIAILPIAQAPASGSQAAALVGEIPALTIPLFAVIGSIGGLLVFTSDRNKGVYEYLIAYGVDPSTIFWSTIAATLCLVSIPLAAGVAESLLALALGNGVSVALVELILFYSIPLSFASAAFMCATGMIWSSLTTQMAGVNSPVGIAPVLGISPVLVVFLVAIRAGGLFVYVAGGASLVLVAASVGVVYFGTKKMVRERFLSNG
jgi:hypothetical protein